MKIPSRREYTADEICGRAPSRARRQSRAKRIRLTVGAVSHRAYFADSRKSARWDTAHSAAAPRLESAVRLETLTGIRDLSPDLPLVPQWGSMITNDAVEKACAEVGAYSDDRMSTEFDRFFQEQPSVCEFVIELTTESSPEIQELSLFLSYMVFKAVKMGTPGELAAVAPDRIEAAYHESELWIDRISQAQEGAMSAGLIKDLQGEGEPHLIQFVISELNQPLESGAPLEDEEKGEVFFVLKTVISSLARRPFGAETEKQIEPK